MTNPTNPTGLNVAQMLATYLDRQIEAADQGLGYPDFAGEATPYDATPVQPIDPSLAWKDAVAVTRLLSMPTTKWEVPPAWATLVTHQEPAVAIAFCLGNYPQMVRHLQPLLTAEPVALRQETGRPLAVPGLAEWSAQVQTTPGRLLAAGALRLARQFDRAAELLGQAAEEPWTAVRDNEAAALAWHRGDREEALATWLRLPANPAVLFNRGMAALFLGQKSLAVESLSAAVACLPETSAWHHLGSLYLALAGVEAA